MKLPGETNDRVHRDSAVHAGEPQQSDRLDRRPQRRPELRQSDRLRLPQDPAGGRSAADRGAHRSERAAVRAVVALEPAGIARAARQPDRHAGRPRRCCTPSRSTCRRTAARCRNCGSWYWRSRIGWPTGRRSKQLWPALFGNAAIDTRRAVAIIHADAARAGFAQCGTGHAGRPDQPGSRRPHLGCGTRSRRLPAAHRRRQTRRSRAATRGAEAETRGAAAASPLDRKSLHHRGHGEITENTDPLEEIRALRFRTVLSVVVRFYGTRCANVIR